MNTYIMVDTKNRLTTNGEVHDLVKFAKETLYINPRRLVRKPFPHFVLNQQMRFDALKAGAAEVTNEHTENIHRHIIAKPKRRRKEVKWRSGYVE
jgi:hypothetical protein